jgi:hypothetical protein
MTKKKKKRSTTKNIKVEQHEPTKPGMNSGAPEG